MLIWNFNGQGPYSLPGAVFVAALGTSASFTAGCPVAYSGMAIANPPTVAGKVPVKLVPLQVNFSGIGTGTGTGAWGLVKITGGTATYGTLSAFSGIVTSPGSVGTTTGVAIVTGTFTVLNGTAGPSANGLNYIQYLGAVGGTATQYPPSAVQAQLDGLLSVMPGEIMAIAPTAAMLGVGSIAWVEVPLNSGA